MDLQAKRRQLEELRAAREAKLRAAELAVMPSSVLPDAVGDATHAGVSFAQPGTAVTTSAGGVASAREALLLSRSTRFCDAAVQVSLVDTAVCTNVCVAPSRGDATDNHAVVSPDHAATPVHMASQNVRRVGFGVFAALDDQCRRTLRAKRSCLRPCALLSPYAFLLPDDTRVARCVTTMLLPYTGVRATHTARHAATSRAAADPAASMAFEAAVVAADGRRVRRARRAMLGVACVAVALTAANRDTAGPHTSTYATPAPYHTSAAARSCTHRHDEQRTPPPQQQHLATSAQTATSACSDRVTAARRQRASLLSSLGAASAAAARADDGVVGGVLYAHDYAADFDDCNNINDNNNGSHFLWGMPPHAAASAASPYVTPHHRTRPTTTAVATTAVASASLARAADAKPTTMTTTTEALWSPSSVVEQCRTLLRSCDGVVMACITIALDHHRHGDDDAVDTTVTRRRGGTTNRAAAALSSSCAVRASELDDDDVDDDDDVVVVLVPLVCDAAVTTLLAHAYESYTLLAGTADGAVVGWSLRDACVHTRAGAVATTTTATQPWWSLSPRQLRQLAWSTTGTATTLLLPPQRPCYTSWPSPLMHGGAVLQLTVRGLRDRVEDVDDGAGHAHVRAPHRVYSLGEDGRVCVWPRFVRAVPQTARATRTAYLGSHAVDQRVSAAAFVDDARTAAAAAAAALSPSSTARDGSDDDDDDRDAHKHGDVDEGNDDGVSGHTRRQAPQPRSARREDDDDDSDDDDECGLRVFMCTTAGELLAGRARDAHVIELQRCRGGGGGDTRAPVAATTTTATAAAAAGVATMTKNSDADALSTASPMWAAVMCIAVQPPRPRPRRQGSDRDDDNNDSDNDNNDNNNDDRAVLVVALDGGVWLWQRSGGYTEVRGATSAVACVCWSPARHDLFAAADVDGVVYVWSVHTSLHVPLQYTSLTHAYAATEAGAAASAARGTAVLPSPLRRLRHTHATDTAAATTTSFAAATAAAREAMSTTGHADAVATALNADMHVAITCLAFSRDGAWLFAGAADGAVHVLSLSRDLCRDAVT